MRYALFCISNTTIKLRSSGLNDKPTPVRCFFTPKRAVMFLVVPSFLMNVTPKILPLVFKISSFIILHLLVYHSISLHSSTIPNSSAECVRQGWRLVSPLSCWFAIHNLKLITSFRGRCIGMQSHDRIIGGLLRWVVPQLACLIYWMGEHPWTPQLIALWLVSCWFWVFSVGFWVVSVDLVLIFFC